MTRHVTIGRSAVCAHQSWLLQRLLGLFALVRKRQAVCSEL